MGSLPQIIHYFEPKRAEPQLLMDGNEPVAATPVPLHQFPDAVSESLYDERSTHSILRCDHFAGEHGIRKTHTHTSIGKAEEFLKRKEKALSQDLEKAEKSEIIVYKANLYSQIYIKLRADKNRLNYKITIVLILKHLRFLSIQNRPLPTMLKLFQEIH